MAVQGGTIKLRHVATVVMAARCWLAKSATIHESAIATRLQGASSHLPLQRVTKSGLASKRKIAHARLWAARDDYTLYMAMVVASL